jgi:hypothetical protein
MLTNKYVVALVVPVLLLLTGALGKKLASKRPWQQEDFHLGVEFTLAALSAAFTQVLDLARDLSKSAANADAPAIMRAGVFAVLSFFLLLLVLSLHQDWQVPPVPEGADPAAVRRKQFWRLVVVGNAVGAGLMICFTLLVRGVS